jgi:hypothetical protein
VSTVLVAIQHELLHMTMSDLVIDIKDLLSLSKLDPSHLSDYKANAIQKQAENLKINVQNLFLNHFLKKFESHFLPSFKKRKKVIQARRQGQSRQC